MILKRIKIRIDQCFFIKLIEFVMIYDIVD